ncbi:MAG: hypothetical protein WA183_09490, partial [Chthoniobacterales bacterium]
MKPDISLATKTGHFNLLPTPARKCVPGESTGKAFHHRGTEIPRKSFLAILRVLCIPLLKTEY